MRVLQTEVSVSIQIRASRRVNREAQAAVDVHPVEPASRTTVNQTAHGQIGLCLERRYNHV